MGVWVDRYRDGARGLHDRCGSGAARRAGCGPASPAHEVQLAAVLGGAAADGVTGRASGGSARRAAQLKLRATNGARYERCALQLRDVGDVDAERRREIVLVLLLVAEDLAEVFRNRVLAEALRLADAFAIVAHRLVLVVQIEAQHVLRLVRDL